MTALPLEDVLTRADLDDGYVLALHRGGCTPAEIASRLDAMTGVFVAAEHVTDWLYDHGYPACTAIHGLAMCERPARAGTNPPRCTTCDRSTR